MINKAILNVDGGARGNPGPAGAGVSLVDAANNEAIFEAGFWLGEMTNNMAEYTGLVRGLEVAIRGKVQMLTVFADSELMVKQINGEYRVKNANLKPLFTDVVGKLRLIPTWEVKHVRREENKRADQLANLAMDAQDDYIACDEIAVGAE